MRFSKMIKHRYNLGNIFIFGLFAERMKKNIQIIYNHNIKRKLNRYSRGL